ncbi:major capsid protein [Chromobacterium violaceum]|uniref:major capsid protein n=1 Tax=Chromobacterium violaceum TaxID=536 RepID=UPI0009D98F36|nr:major capsid protein [Chromobacterium violaceum]OQS10071.1 hypothetical protein B0T38_10900 [Chromobacterium violaceum]OQS26486.1 hypothetical protein B0T37_10505 [Chromobacterium violaceum]QRO33970.1 hypothetical protein I6K04_04295 [Chromobacterium violaceum]QRQ16227.1 hypothetical protein I6K03_18435 [Chromobacterium violaceum]
MAFDLQVFNKQTYLTITETVANEVNKFNEASQGTIVLQNAPVSGDFDITASFKAISGLVRRRNVYSNAAVESKRLQQLLNASVKVAAGTPPIDYEPAQYQWVLQNPELAALKIGEQLAKARVADMLDTGIRGAVAALSGNAAVSTGDGTEDPSFRLLNKASFKFGDRSSAILAWVLHSSTLSKLYDNALANTERLFSYDGVNVLRDPFGRLFVVTDSEALVVPGAANADPKFRTLGLVGNGVVVSGNDDFNSVIVPKVGTENIGATYQAEWSYNLGIAGYTWDMANGGKSPTNTAIGTGSNWDQTATSHKDTAGVILTTK